MIGNFPEFMRPVAIVKKTSVGVYVGGEWEEGSTEETSAQMVTIPVTPAQLRSLPEGRYQAGDMKFYHSGSPIFQAGDIFTLDDVKYEVKDITDRSFNGDFTLYMGKRIYDQT